MPLFVFLLWLLPQTALAQGFIIDVPGGRETPLAVAKPATPSGDPKGDAKVVSETLRQDLDISGYFKMIPENAQIEGKDAGVEPGSFKMTDWSILKASVLVKTRILPAGDATCDPSGKKSCVDAFVYYVVTGEKLLAKRYKADPGSTRHVAHAIANDVLAAVTGRPGFFGIGITAVGSRGGNKEIFVLGLDGKDVKQVTRNGSINLSPAWSPDGGTLAWTSYKKANPDLYLKTLATGQTRVISNASGINTSPAFSPDGSRIALARSSGGDSDIFLIDAKTGKQLDQVTTGGGIDVAPTWSSDGKLLLFASERSGGSQIYGKDLTTGQVKRLSFVGDFNTDPVISPKGDQIAFVTRSEGGFDIVVAGIDGRNAVRITQDMGDNEDPSWSPDGQYLLFSSTRAGRQELWISTADGRHQVRLTTSGGWTQPSFAPYSDK